jgi:hypothetical protein
MSAGATEGGRVGLCGTALTADRAARHSCGDRSGDCDERIELLALLGASAFHEAVLGRVAHRGAGCASKCRSHCHKARD